MMVLFTAIKNFRQYRAKNSNALSLADLSSVSFIEHCSNSGSVGTAKDMEIERYHAAFPALGTAVSPGYMDHFDLSNIGSRDHETCQMRTRSNAADTARPALSKAKHNNNHYHPRSQTVRERGSHSGFSNDNHYNHNKRTSRHFAGKSRKVYREKHSEAKSRAKKKLNDSKPWKHLEAVEHSIETTGSGCCGVVSDENETSAEEWIPDDVLQSVLASGSEDDCYRMDHLKSVWPAEPVDTSQQVLSSTWKFDDTADDSTSLSLVNGSMNCLTNTQCDSSTDFTDGNEESPAPTDFSLIEQSLASLSFCEDLPDTSQGSRFMSLFREDPFANMIQNSRSNNLDASEFVPAYTSFSCQHCQEAYEVVLDMESSGCSESAKHDGFIGQIDSRLNFDWCRYHQPTWTTEADGESDKTKSLTPMFSCDCGFCRSRAWKTTCRLCGTPV